jgi:hypothetical protein
MLDKQSSSAEFDIDLRDRYNALSLKIDYMNLEKNPATIKREITKLTKKLNTEVYKTLRQEYLSQNEHEKYVELLALAKKHGLK